MDHQKSDFSVELTNQDTSEIKVVSFDSEEERERFIDHLPDHVTWAKFENHTLFRKKLDWELALR